MIKDSDRIKVEFSHLTDFRDITAEEWNMLYALASDIYEHPADYAGVCSGKLLGTLFYEPSTRTQLSFQAAMIRLGGNVIGFSDPARSSVSKGESLVDTIRIISGYCDLLAMRTAVEGSALAASYYSSVPVINAGDGGHLHPTQTLTDLFTITRLKGTLTGLCIGICGDLLNGRTVHSLAGALSRYHGNTIYLISTGELKIPMWCQKLLISSGNRIIETQSLEECIPRLDVLYMTRIQKERFNSESEYIAQSKVYRLDEDKLYFAKKDLLIMHPLPKVDEIVPAVDDDPRAGYFDQARFGMYVRMALIISLCEKPFVKKPSPRAFTGTRKCTNPKCVTAFEHYLQPFMRRDGDEIRCVYCDKKI
ncbi:MAG: aspartate carbamoyltransferase [Oscillospiraceae bacterium]|nr:aspartate carbamoyltransferase [Oscillospiraceae bacterium]